ncbi:MAG: hypothetical protein M1831_003807 [Alyxoria varia]|nr:MAG: hypothetical protein M1831_003807 [Alyxoria varia]
MDGGRIRMGYSIGPIPVSNILQFYVGDICALRSDTSRRGVVGRTFEDLDSHDESIPSEEGEEYLYRRHALVSKASYNEFLRSGVPPRHTVCIDWQEASDTAELIPTSELIIEDRELLFGDIVKDSFTTAKSGVLVDSRTLVDLVRHPFWTPSTSCTLRDIPAEALMNSSPLLEEDTVIYKDCVGTIEAVQEELTIRLSNNSVVIPKSSEDVLPYVEGADGPSAEGADLPSIGCQVSSKQANIRRGKWIFGSYDPNISPIGHVIDKSVSSVEVSWTRHRQPTSTLTYPPEVLEREDIEGPHFKLYDPHLLPGESGDVERPNVETSNTPHFKPLEVNIGDSVLFRNLNEAKAKYNVPPIPRTETSGYNLNHFQVIRMKTEATVLWQDMSFGKLPTTDLLPCLDLDFEDEVWPGEFIATKSRSDVFNDVTDWVLVPARIGIVQAVNSDDRTAQVRWFEGSASFEQHSLWLLDAYTGNLDERVETVSMYDIWNIPGLARRLGDIVSFCMPSERSDADRHLGKLHSEYFIAMELVNSPTEARAWLGEVVELCLDGCLRVRLGAATPVREVRVPWECTEMVHGVDSQDMGSEESSESSSEAEYLDDDRESTNNVWRDETDQPIEEDETEWSTDENPMDESPVSYEDQKEIAGEYDEDSVLEDAPAHTFIQPSSAKFTYASMFTTLVPNLTEDASHGSTAAAPPKPFLVLDGEAPSDHGFASRSPRGVSSLRRIQKEYDVLQSSLPEGIFVRTWESSLDLMRVLILGPLDTPYEYAPFIIDLYLDDSFPTRPPKAHFHSWTDGSGPVNPNLYEDGKICLSLLGTWPGTAQTESWSPRSTVLQVLVSLVGLVLVKEPFYNEAGFESRIGMEASHVPSQVYSERTFLRSRGFLIHAMRNPVRGFETILQSIYKTTQAGHPMLLVRAIWSSLQTIRRGRRENTSQDPIRHLSAGAASPLRRHVELLIEILDGDDKVAAATFRQMLNDSGYTPPEGPCGVLSEFSQDK